MSETGNGTLINTDDSKHATITYKELDLKIEGMIEKNEELWKCKVCGKTSVLKRNIQSHSEIIIIMSLFRTQSNKLDGTA